MTTKVIFYKDRNSKEGKRLTEIVNDCSWLLNV